MNDLFGSDSESDDERPGKTNSFTQLAIIVRRLNVGGFTQVIVLVGAQRSRPRQRPSRRSSMLTSSLGDRMTQTTRYGAIDVMRSIVH